MTFKYQNRYFEYPKNACSSCQPGCFGSEKSSSKAPKAGLVISIHAIPVVERELEIILDHSAGIELLVSDFCDLLALTLEHYVKAAFLKCTLVVPKCDTNLPWRLLGETCLPLRSYAASNSRMSLLLGCILPRGCRSFLITKGSPPQG